MKIAFALLALVSTAFATDPKDTMCVKQKDGHLQMQSQR
jgi:hypothetical protein